MGLETQREQGTLPTQLQSSYGHAYPPWGCFLSKCNQRGAPESFLGHWDFDYEGVYITFVKAHTSVDLTICAFYHPFMTISREIKHPVVVARSLGFREDTQHVPTEAPRPKLTSGASSSSLVSLWRLLAWEPVSRRLCAGGSELLSRRFLSSF